MFQNFIDLCDKRSVSYVLSDHNDNPLVFKTFDAAVAANPDAHPLFHSDYAEENTMSKFFETLYKYCA